MLDVCDVAHGLAIRLPAQDALHRRHVVLLGLELELELELELGSRIGIVLGIGLRLGLGLAVPRVPLFPLQCPPRRLPRRSPPSPKVRMPGGGLALGYRSGFGL